MTTDVSGFGRVEVGGSRPDLGEREKWDTRPAEPRGPELLVGDGGAPLLGLPRGLAGARGFTPDGAAWWWSV